VKKGRINRKFLSIFLTISAIHSFGSRNYSKMSAMEDLMNEFDMEMRLQASKTHHEEIEGEFDKKRVF
jgi:hypothetical protein